MTLDDIQKTIDVLEDAHSVVLSEYWSDYDLVIQLAERIEFFKAMEKRIGAAAIEQVIWTIEPCRALQLKCAFPDCPMPADHLRQNTAYHYDAENFADLCYVHQRQADVEWEERWAEYYRGVL